MNATACKIQKLGDIITLEKGKPPTQQPYFGPDAELYLTPEYLRRRGAAEPVKASANAVRVSDGDSIVLWDGSNAGEFFRGRKGILASTMSRIQHGETFDKKYFFYAVKNWESYLKGQTSGSGIPHVDKDVLGKIEIFEFDKYEQTKIAEILSTVDRAIEQTEALIAKQQRIKTGLMQDLLTRGIDEHGNLRSEQTHKFKDSPLGRIPMEWEVLKWSEVSSKIQDGTHFSPRTDESAEFKYVTSRNIKFGYLDLSDVEYINRRQHDEIYKRCDVLPGDVLLTKDGANTGNAAINLLKEPFSLLSSVAFIRPKKGKLTSMFLLQAILSENGQRLIKDSMSGLAITRVTLEIINNFLIKIPPIQEQNNIGEFLAVEDRRINMEAKKLAKFHSLKTALMQDLLTGRKRVTALQNDIDVVSVAPLNVLEKEDLR